MKCAICVSGMPRNIENSYKWMKESVLDILDNHEIKWDIFISSWSEKNNFYNYRKFIEIFKPIFYEGLEWDSEIENIIGWQKFKEHKFEIEPRSSCLAQFYKISECNYLKNRYEIENNIKYDLVFRTRTELRYNTKLDIKELQIAKNNKDVIFLRRGPNPQYINWVKDNFAFGGSEAMDIYSNCFHSLLEISRNTKVSTAELILRNYLALQNLKLEHTSLDYTITRMN